MADHKQCSGNHHERGKYLPVEFVPLAVRFACQNIGLGSSLCKTQIIDDSPLQRFE